MKQSAISGKPISALDTMLELQMPMGTEATIVHLSLEDALDLSVCMSYNPMNLDIKEPFNAFKLHFD